MSKAMQLKDKIKNLALKNHVPAQAVLQNFMLERLLERISLSQFKEKIVLKGGMLADQVQKIGFEIAILETRGLDINDSTPKYTLQSMPGKFSGLHLLCFEYVAFQQIAPGKDIGFDLSAEYQTARSLFEKKASGEQG